MEGDLVMDMKTLRLFTTLERYSSLSEAAEKSFISRQGLSKSIAAIESELGVALLRRSRSGYQFTAHGRKFLEHARSLVEEYDLALSDILHDHAELAESERVNAVCTPYVLESALDSMLITRIISYGKVSVMPFHDLVEAALSGGTDTLYAAEVFPETEEELRQRGVECVPLFRIEPGILCGASNPLPNAETAVPQDLAGKPLIVNSNKTAQRYCEHVSSQVDGLDIQASVGAWSMLIDAVHSDSLVALFDSYQFKCMTIGDDKRLSGLRFTPFADKGMRFNLCILYAKDVDLSPACIRYINHLQAIFAT